jgi:hypothetical protein
MHPATAAALARRKAIIDATPGLAEALAKNDTLPFSNFRADVAIKIRKDPKKASSRMIDAFIKAVAKDSVWADKKAAREAADAVKAADLTAKGVTAPSGRVAVKGKVVHVKTVVTKFGAAEKMLVELDTGAKVWVSVPADLSGFPIKGATIAFTATFTVSDNDPLFAFGKRPTGAVVLEDSPEMAAAKLAEATAGARAMLATAPAAGGFTEEDRANAFGEALPSFAFDMEAIKNIAHVGHGF